MLGMFRSVLGRGDCEIRMIEEQTNFNELMTKDKFIQIADEELEFAKKRILARLKRAFRDGNQASARTNMRLKFRNRISQTILAGMEIKGEGDASIEVALVDDQTGNVVDDTPEASASVEIVLLKGGADDSEGDDWTVEEFNEKIVPEVEGKQPLLAGNVPLKLQRGIGVVKNVKLKNHASKERPPVFKLGARVVGASGGRRIKEAKTECFTVKDFRCKYYEKHETPSLSDEVFRLVNIRKGGKIHKRLQDDGINTVEDFLIRLLIHPEGLKSIVHSQKTKWQATVNNARACPSESRMYCYVNLEQKMGVVFNVLGQVLGLYLKSHYSPNDLLSEKQENDTRELLASAYKNWGDVKPFDCMNSVQQYFADLSTLMEDAGMMRQSSVGHSNNLFCRKSSTMDSFEETGADDFSWLCTDNGGIMHLFGETGADDVGWFNTDNGGIMYDPVQFSPGWPLSILQDDYESMGKCSGNMQQLDGLMNESNADEKGAAVAVTRDES